MRKQVRINIMATVTRHAPCPQQAGVLPSQNVFLSTHAGIDPPERRAHFQCTRTKLQGYSSKVHCWYQAHTEHASTSAYPQAKLWPRVHGTHCHTHRPKHKHPTACTVHTLDHCLVTKGPEAGVASVQEVTSF